MGLLLEDQRTDELLDSTLKEEFVEHREALSTYLGS
jgi:hypothetical protein